MFMKRMMFVLTLFVVLLISACSPASAASSAPSPIVEGSSDADTSADATSDSALIQSVSATVAATVTEAVAQNSAPHATAEASATDPSRTTTITLDGDTIGVKGEGVMVEGSTATIMAAGSYRVSGTLNDGQIVVDSKDEAAVEIVLDGATIRNGSSAAIYIANVQEAIIVLEEDSVNELADGATYLFANPDEDEPNAALFSQDNLTITGSGSLSVTGNFNDGISSDDGLVIASGTITVNAADDGIRSKDYVVIEDGTLDVTSQGDGLKASNDEDPTLGYISIVGGSVTVNAGGDALSAETDILISDGSFVLTSGGGAGQALAEDASAKGIKGLVEVVIDGGSFMINAEDDAIHSNNSIVINQGTFQIASGDDGIHADATVEINSGTVAVTQSYEGIEAALITLNGGDISVVASDDGINVADGSGGVMGPGGPMGGGTTAATYTGSSYLRINGGTITVDAAGDGVDVNGAITMTGGTLLVNGPTMQGNGALDYDGGFAISGGTLIAVGSAGMAQAPDSSSSQNVLLLNLTTSYQAGTPVTISSSDGSQIATVTPTKAFQSIAFSSSDLVTGDSYTVTIGGTQAAPFIVSSVVTQVGTAGGGMRGPRP